MNDEISHEIDCVGISRNNHPHTIQCEHGSKDFDLYLFFPVSLGNQANWVQQYHTDNDLGTRVDTITAETIQVSNVNTNVNIAHQFLIDDVNNHYNQLPRYIYVLNRTLSDYDAGGIDISYPFDVKLLTSLAFQFAFDSKYIPIASGANNRFASIIVKPLVRSVGVENSYTLELNIPSVYIKAWNTAIASNEVE